MLSFNDEGVKEEAPHHKGGKSAPTHVVQGKVTNWLSTSTFYL